MLLESAQRVMIVPGYGMAVSQAQHSVRDLTRLLESRGVRVDFGIHPVAGRMPGHMNVLLAEADIPYEKLLTLEEANPMMEQTDVCIVIGANDVVNPVARADSQSPIAGMPILDVDKSRTVVVADVFRRRQESDGGPDRSPERRIARRHFFLFCI
jgi:NAD(P) transhydrogenase subunit beta